MHKIWIDEAQLEDKLLVIERGCVAVFATGYKTLQIMALATFDCWLQLPSDSSCLHLLAVGFP